MTSWILKIIPRTSTSNFRIGITGAFFFSSLAFNLCCPRRPKKIEIREDGRTGAVFLTGSDTLYTSVESIQHARRIIQAGVSVQLPLAMFLVSTSRVPLDAAKDKCNNDDERTKLPLARHSHFLHRISPGAERICPRYEHDRSLNYNTAYRETSFCSNHGQAASSRSCWKRKIGPLCG